MRSIKLGTSSLEVPVIAIGCMRMNVLSQSEAENFIAAALDKGACFFDHADIYGGGRSEEIFANAIHMDGSVRGRVLLQSKCGIREGGYDFSKQHILASVDGILKRLRTDHLDVLLLHRPDALIEPEEVAEAFVKLEISGKALHFGVSNQNPMQIKLLQKYVGQPIAANQLQLSVANAGMIASGINVNTQNSFAPDRDGSVLDFCRLNNITVQAWSPLQYGNMEGSFIGSDKFPELNKKLGEIAAKYGVSAAAIAIAWILRHPARIQVIAGTMNAEHLSEYCKAADITLTRGEWYEIYRAAGYNLP